MESSTHTAAPAERWRPWLYASLPPLFLYGACAVLALCSLEPRYEPDAGMQFTLSDVHVVIPLTIRLLFLWAFLTPLILSRIFFRWGKQHRDALNASLVLIALPWALGTLQLLMGWRLNVLQLLYASSSGGLGTLAAGMAEYLSVPSSMAGVTAALLASLLTLLILEDRWHRRRVSEHGSLGHGTHRARRLTFFAAIASLVSIAGAGLAAWAGREFFADLAMYELTDWRDARDSTAKAWAVLQAVQLTAAFAGLVALALAGRGADRKTRAPWLAALLLGAAHAGHVASQQHVFAGAVRFLGLEGSSAAPSLLSGDEYSYQALKPALGLGAEGLSLGGTLQVRWDAGGDHVQQWLAGYLQAQSFHVYGERHPPPSLAVGLEANVTLSAVQCFIGVARRLGTSALALASGPEREVPDRTRRALTFVAPVLGRAFSQRVSTTTLYLADARCPASGAERGGELTLGSARSPQEPSGGVLVEGWRCITLRVPPEATVRDLLAFLHGEGSNAEIFVEGDTEAACAAGAR